MKYRVKQALNKKVEGIGVIEIVLILVVVIGLVIIFKNQIYGVINTVFGEITKNTDSFIIEDVY